MDSGTVFVIVIALFALIAVGAFIVYRRRAKITVDGPLGTRLTVDASDEETPPEPAVNVQDAVSREGGLVADDKTGRGSNVQRVNTKDDILVSSSPPDPSDPN